VVVVVVRAHYSCYYCCCLPATSRWPSLFPAGQDPFPQQHEPAPFWHVPPYPMDSSDFSPGAWRQERQAIIHFSLLSNREFFPPLLQALCAFMAYWSTSTSTLPLSLLDPTNPFRHLTGWIYLWTGGHTLPTPWTKKRLYTANTPAKSGTNRYYYQQSTNFLEV
jgi:hypothetical protein